MAGRLPVAELERALIDIGARLEDPPEVDLAFMVGTRLRQEARAPARSRRLRLPEWVPRLEWRTLTYATAAVVVILAGVLIFSPGARNAVAGWLGLRGVEIEVIESPRPSTPPSGPQILNLGRQVTLGQAQREVGFRVLLPTFPGLGRPDEVHVQPLYISEQVFLVYRARPGLPATPQTGVALLISEFRAQPDEGYYKKISIGQGNVEFLRVDGDPGYWIEGAHELSYVDPNGIPIQDTARLAGNVLLWQRGDLTLRIESSLTKAEVLRIARSFA
jgi:hypothetical protein